MIVVDEEGTTMQANVLKRWFSIYASVEGYRLLLHYTPLDVIGFVADVGEVKNIKTSKGKDTYKVNVLIQDLKMQKIFFFNNTAEVNLSKVKQVVIVATKSFMSAKLWGATQLLFRVRKG
ncbi:hypothetical protein L1987_15529 [Smallanthus sonchifolius]|uniref:Uncharacterized protein n=1 Tax=Smallanthus sonchifolius TaxID=185202 RepID=A0ACB9J7Z6_9ASTR|nr:hypothetical protein L1987_15529 [Smallanthus sonchifolius]